MAEADGEKTKTEAKAPAAGAPPSDYGDKVLGAIQWMLGALGTVALTALGKIAFDQLRDGDYGNSRWLLTFGSAIAFGIGLVALVSGVVATTTVSSVGISWLRHAKEPNGRWKKMWRWSNLTFFGRDPYLAWEVVRSLADGKYLVPGATGTSPPEILTSFTTNLGDMVADQYNDPGTFAADLNKVDQLRILTGARKNVLEVAKRARLQQVSRQIPSRFLAGTILAVFGAVGFGFATAQAKREAAILDRNAEQIVTGELLPKVPTAVRVLFPASLADRAGQQMQLSIDEKASCDMDSVDGVLIAISTPPEDPKLNSTDVMHVFTFASATCTSRELWLPPERVIMPPAQKKAPAASGGDSSSTTTPSP